MCTYRTRIGVALLALSTTACGSSGVDPGSGAPIKTLFVTAVGETLHGLNRSYQFELVALDEDGEALSGLDVTWGTSDATVATIDQSGVVVTKQVGAVQISAAVQDTSAEAAILVDDRAATIAGGKGFVCALDQTGAAYCWGYGDGTGTLGDGSSASSPTPVPVAGNLRFHSLSAGWDFHTCGLTTEGHAYCWGRNVSGELGDGTVGINRPTPVPVAGDIKFKYLRTGAAHTCGVAFDGKAHCWGLNERGQLGTEVTETCSIGPCSTVPVPVATDLTFTSLSLSNERSCGIATDELLYCWGGTPTLQWDVRFRYVRSAHSWECGMGTDDQVYCWSGLAQTIAPSPTPTLVPDQPQLVFLSEANGGHICGLDAEGVAYCWGDSINGALGLGPDLWRTLSPVAVSADLRFYAIGAGDAHTCAITIGFEVYCWGSNWTGQLGDGTTDGDPDCPVDTSCRTRPVRVLFDPNR